MQGQGAGDVFVFHCMARADIRIRVRPGVIRVRIGETAVRTVIRITAPDHNLSSHPLLPTILTCQLSASPLRRAGMQEDGLPKLVHWLGDSIDSKSLTRSG